MEGGSLGRFGDGVGFGAVGLNGLGGGIGFLWAGSGFLDGFVGFVGLRISGLGEGGGGEGRLWTGMSDMDGRLCTTGVGGAGSLETLTGGLLSLVEGRRRGGFGAFLDDVSERDGIFVWKLNVGLETSCCCNELPCSGGNGNSSSYSYS